MRGGVEGIEPDFHYSSKRLDEGLNTTFWQNTPPSIKSNKIHTYSDSKEAHAWVCLYVMGWKSGVSTVWASAGGNQERLHLEFHVVANKNICGQACRAYLSRLLFVLSGSPHRCLLDNITTHSQTFFFQFVHWLLHSPVLHVGKDKYLLNTRVAVLFINPAHVGAFFMSSF